MKIKIILLAITTIFCYITAKSQDEGETLWQVQSGNWNVASNWSHGIQAPVAMAYIENGGTATVNTNISFNGTLLIGDTDYSGGSSGYLQITNGGKLQLTSHIGNDRGTAGINVNGGELSCTQLLLNHEINSEATLSLSNNAIVSAGKIHLGTGPTGQMSITIGSGCQLIERDYEEFEIGNDTEGSATTLLAGSGTIIVNQAPPYAFLRIHKSAIISPGDAVGTIGTLTINSGLTYMLNGTTLHVDLDASNTSDKIMMNGSAEVGQIVIDIQNIVPGDYTLMECTGTLNYANNATIKYQGGAYPAVVEGGYMATVKKVDNKLVLSIHQLNIADYFCDGTGTDIDPYQICSIEKLTNLATLLNTGVSFSGKHFLLTADLDLSSVPNWASIGTFTYPFKGDFDGNKHTISNVRITSTEGNRGLFGVIDEATVHDLSVVNALVNGTTGGAWNYGIIAGFAINSAISGCYTSGTVDAVGNVGGIAGLLQGGTLTNCYSSSDIKGLSAGSITGALTDNGIVSHCYTLGKVDGFNGNAGGVAGLLNTSTLQNCVAMNPVITTAGTTGRVFGIDEINNSTFTDNYAFENLMVNGAIVSGGASDNKDGANLTASQLRTAAVYPSWNFSTSWTIRENNSYPYFAWQSTPVNHIGLEASATTIHFTLLNAADSVVLYKNGVQSEVFTALQAGQHQIAYSSADKDILNFVVYEPTKSPSYPAQTIVKLTGSLSAADKSTTYNRLGQQVDSVFLQVNTINTGAKNWITYDYYQDGTLLTALPKNAGTYKVIARFAGNDTIISCQSDSVILTITPKTLSVSGMVINSKVYDGNVTATVNDWGTLNGVETGDVVSINQTTAIANFDNKNVGTNKAVTFSTLSLTGTNTGNYTLTQPTGLTANITSLPVTVTANPQTKFYGQTNPALTYTVNPSLATGDAFTGSLTRVPGESIGTYEILQNTLALSSNYAMTYVKNYLTITAVPTQITAQPQGAVICSGSNHAMQVEVRGSGITYQWYADNVAIPGAISADYATGQEGIYYVEVSGLDGQTITSGTAQVSFYTPLDIQSIQITGLDDIVNTGVQYTAQLTGSNLSNIIHYSWAYEGQTYGNFVTINNPSGASGQSVNLTFGPVAKSGLLRVEMQDICGTTYSVEKNLTVSYPTGLEELKLDGLKVFPNPFGNEVRIQGAQGCTLWIVNASGATVYSKELVNTEETIQTNQLAKGVYVFRLVKDGKVKTVKGLKK